MALSESFHVLYKGQKRSRHIFRFIHERIPNNARFPIGSRYIKINKNPICFTSIFLQGRFCFAKFISRSLIHHLDINSLVYAQSERSLTYSLKILHGHIVIQEVLQSSINLKTFDKIYFVIKRLPTRTSKYLQIFKH